MSFNFINTGLDDQILKSLNAETPDEDLQKAMNRQGLVQKEVQVKGKNGTFTRKQWVKVGEDQKNDSGKSLEELQQEYRQYVTQHPNPTDEDRKKAAEIRDAIDKKVQEKYGSAKQQMRQDADKAASAKRANNSKKLQPMSPDTKKKTDKFIQDLTHSSDKSSKDTNIEDYFSGNHGHDGKKVITDLLGKGYTRSDLMEQAKKSGVTWKESDHEGINWMRASMAIQKHINTQSTTQQDEGYQEFSGLSSKSMSYIKKFYKPPHEERKKLVQLWEERKQEDKRQTLSDRTKYSIYSLEIGGETYWVSTPEHLYEEYKNSYNPDLELLKKHSVDGVVLLKPKPFSVPDRYHVDEEILAHPITITDEIKKEIQRAEKEWQDDSLKDMEHQQEISLEMHDKFINEVYQTMKLHDQFGTTPIEPGQVHVGDTVKTRIILDDNHAPIEVTGTVSYVYKKNMQNKIADSAGERGGPNSIAARWRTDAGSYGGDGIKIKWDLTSVTDSSLKRSDMSNLRYLLKDKYTKLDGNELCQGRIYL